MKRFAVYTAVIGAYDSVKQPLYVDDDFDYYLFTNSPKSTREGVWIVKPTNYENTDLIRIARYIKTHSHSLLSNYDATLWVDANLQIADRYLYDKVRSLYEYNVHIASVQHPVRDCIYLEAFTITRWKFEYERVTMSWCNKLLEENYPMHNGLYETNIFYRNNSEIVKMFNISWWNCISNYSKRDQLSCNYIMWKQKIPCVYILPQGEHSMNSTHVNYSYHNKVSKRKIVPLTFSENLRTLLMTCLPIYGFKSFMAISNNKYSSFKVFIWGWLSIFIFTPYILLLKLYKIISNYISHL